MNDILLNHLLLVPNCNAKNLSSIICEYSEYTEIEERFHQAIVERSLKTGYEDSKRYIDEVQILDFFRDPWNYQHLRIDYFHALLEYFLEEWYYPNGEFTVLNDIFASNLKEYTYESLLDCIGLSSDNENPKDYNTFYHLLWLSMHYGSEYERLLREHVKLSDEEIDTLFETAF